MTKSLEVLGAGVAVQLVQNNLKQRCRSWVAMTVFAGGVIINCVRGGPVKSSIKLLSWSSWMASISVVTVTSAWLLAELSTSPLINSLLIGAQNLPALIPLACTIKGIRVFLGAMFLLELIVVFLYFQLLPNWVLIVSTLVVVLLASCGSITSLLPMTGIVLEGNTMTNQSL